MATPDVDLIDEFLSRVWGDTVGYVAIGFKREGERYSGDQFFAWPDDADRVMEAIEDKAHTHHVFWCPNVLASPKRRKGNAVSRRWVWADMDGSPNDPHLLSQLKPIQVASGRPGHVHAYVPLTEPIERDEWHRLARALRDQLGADAKIADNDLLRAPGSVNFKPDAQRRAKLRQVTWVEWRPDALIASVTPAPTRTRHDNGERVPGAQRVSKASIPEPVQRALDKWHNVQRGKRNEAAFAIVRECCKQGVSRAQTTDIIRGEPLAERYKSDRDLVTDVKRIWDNAENETPTSAGRRLVAVRAADIKPRRQKWLVPDRIPLGALTLIGGREGAGKSVICIDYVARVTRGQLDGEFKGQPRGAIYFATEDDRETVIVPRLMAARADLDRVIFLDPDDPEDDFLNLPSDIDELDEMIAENDVALVVLDPILSALDGKVNDTNPRELRRELEPINQMAARRSCAFLGIAHFNKRESNDIGVLMSGLLVWSQVARATIGVVHDPEDDNPDSFIMSNGKNNSTSRSVRSLRGQLVGATVNTNEGPTWTPRVEWLGESEVSVSDVMSPAKPKKKVERWLVELLTENGPMTRPEVIELGKAAGHSQSAIDRARGDLDIESEKGFGGAAKWSLPSHSRASANAPAHDETEKLDNIDNVDKDGGPSPILSTSSTSSISPTSSEVAHAGAREKDDNESDSRAGAPTRPRKRGTRRTARPATAPAREEDDEDPHRAVGGAREPVKAQMLDFSEVDDPPISERRNTGDNMKRREE